VVIALVSTTMLLRRRREAYVWSEPRVSGEYSTPEKILQLQFGLFRRLNQHCRLRLSSKQVHNREERGFDSIDIS
jgi:hypothetical protein